MMVLNEAGDWVDDGDVSASPVPNEGPAAGGAPWWQQPLSYALTAAIDSEFAKPMTFQDSTKYGYAVAPNGQIYVRGQPVPGVAPATPGAPGALLSGSTGMLLMLAVVGAIAFAALKH